MSERSQRSGWRTAGVIVSAFTLCLGLAFCCRAASPTPNLNGHYTATAYSTSGITKSGQYTHRHIVAADPDVLPIGSRIRLRWAGKYSGEYVVADTGRKIQGRRLDIFVPNTPECLRFGRKSVRVKVLALGDGTRQAAKKADETVKQDVAQDVAKGTVGHAATETDWNTKGGPTKAAAEASAKPVTESEAPAAVAQNTSAETSPN